MEKTLRERRREMEGTWHGNFFKEPHPTESRSRDLIELCRQHTKPHPVARWWKRETEHGKVSSVATERAQTVTVCAPGTERDSTLVEVSV